MVLGRRRHFATNVVFLAVVYFCFIYTVKGTSEGDAPSGRSAEIMTHMFGAVKPYAYQQKKTEAKQPVEKSSVEKGAAVPKQAEPSAAPVEPLLELLKLDHSDDLVDRLRPRADQGLMELIPSKTFSALSMAERQQQADVWLAQLQDDGYDRLVLLDEQGRLLGRSAQIGGGMILWSTPQ